VPEQDLETRIGLARAGAWRNSGAAYESKRACRSRKPSQRHARPWFELTVLSDSDRMSTRKHASHHRASALGAGHSQTGVAGAVRHRREHGPRSDPATMACSLRSVYCVDCRCSPDLECTTSLARSPRRRHRGGVWWQSSCRRRPIKRATYRGSTPPASVCWNTHRLILCTSISRLIRAGPEAELQGQ